MKPATSDRNLTPSSTALVSFSWTPVVAGVKIEHGQTCAATVNVTLVGGADVRRVVDGARLRGHRAVRWR